MSSSPSPSESDSRSSFERIDSPTMRELCATVTDWYPKAPPEEEELVDVIEFAKAPPGFDAEKEKLKYIETYHQERGLFDPRDKPEESVYDEIHRRIEEMEAIEGSLPEEEKERIARKIGAFREGAWLEGLKLQFSERGFVPGEAFNRLVAEYEATTTKMAEMMASAERRMIESCRGTDNTNPIWNRTAEDLAESLRDSHQRIIDLKNEMEGDRVRWSQKEDVSHEWLRSEKNRLQAMLDSMSEDLQTSRETASRHYNDLETLRERLGERIQREQRCKEEIIELRREKKDLRDTVNLQFDTLMDLRREVSKLKDEKQREAETKSSQKGNRDPGEAPTRKGDSAIPEDVQNLMSEQRVNLKEPTATVSALREEPEKARKASEPEQHETGTNEELQARCAELREMSDMYRDKWARGVIAGNDNLTQFWTAVENTSREIKQLYQGIEKLSCILGVADGFIHTPGILDKIITEVSDPARYGPTQTHRHYREREVLFRHIVNARAGFLALAERSGDGDAIKALVDRFLQPTSLPTTQLAEGKH
ncbi:hypothetical protein F4861DRAFT_415793 [Xylaria intraflava]|nr:hypothetical protein F4861DRAFT_415793 [Xylaria intraflava]